MQSVVERLAIPFLLAVVSASILLALRAAAFRMLSRWADRTATKFDDIMIAAIKGPSIFWSVALGVYIGVALSDLPQRHIVLISTALHVTIVFSVTMAAANLSGRMFTGYVQQTGLPLPTTGLAYGLLKGVIYVLGALVILGMLGVSVTPLITALGVGGLAVALALQDTLANLFAGIHILIEKSIRVGDFIRLETGQEGYVDDITWRTTRVRMLPNNIVVIPNSKLSQSVVTNYHLPEKRMSLLVPVPVAYASDPDQVERVLIDEAKEAARTVPGLLAEPEPFVRFIPGFGDSSLDFTLICQVAEFTDQYLAQHELRKRILRRFRREGIEIPFPQRTVHLRREAEVR